MRMCQLLLAAHWKTAPEEKFNKDNLDAPIKSKSDSSVEEQITEVWLNRNTLHMLIDIDLNRTSQRTMRILKFLEKVTIF